MKTLKDLFDYRPTRHPVPPVTTRAGALVVRFGHWTIDVKGREFCATGKMRDFFFILGRKRAEFLREREKNSLKKFL